MLEEYDLACKMFNIQMTVVGVAWMILLVWIIAFRGDGCRRIKIIPSSLHFLTLRKWLPVTFFISYAMFFGFAAFFIVANPFVARMILKISAR